MKLLRIKIENILTFLIIPYSIINIAKASREMLLASVVIQALIIFATYYGTKETRKELIKDINDGLLEDIKESLIESLEPLLDAIEITRQVVYSIKKEVISKRPKTTKLKDAF